MQDKDAPKNASGQDAEHESIRTRKNESAASLRRARRRIIQAAGAMFALSLGGLIYSGFAGASASPSSMRAVPAYFNDEANWNKVEAQAGGISYAVMNPHNGPGAAKDAVWTNRLARIGLSNPTIVGYVDISYGARNTNDVVAEIGRYKTWYGVTSIFVDQVTWDCSTEQALRTLGAAVHANGGIMIINPGTVSLNCILDQADVVVSFEGSEATYRASTLAHPAGYPSSKFWHLIYEAAPTKIAELEEIARQRGAGHIYVTSQTMPNPWTIVETFPGSPIVEPPATTVPPATSAPATSAPATTGPRATVPFSATLVPPTTIAPAATTIATVPVVVATLPPVSTAAPTTVAPTTAAPTTAAPTTTVAPTTAAPTTTVAPTTAAPTTAAPTTTVAPTTAAPTTAAPTTAAPTTAAPTTKAPVVTVAPTTAAPTTKAPVVTAAPTTAAPTTKAPTVTAAPTTAAPAPAPAPNPAVTSTTAKPVSPAATLVPPTRPAPAPASAPIAPTPIAPTPSGSSAAPVVSVSGPTAPAPSSPSTAIAPIAKPAPVDNAPAPTVVVTPVSPTPAPPSSTRRTNERNIDGTIVTTTVPKNLALTRPAKPKRTTKRAKAAAPDSKGQAGSKSVALGSSEPAAPKVKSKN